MPKSPLARITVRPRNAGALASASIPFEGLAIGKAHPQKICGLGRCGLSSAPADKIFRQPFSSRYPPPHSTMDAQILPAIMCASI